MTGCVFVAWLTMALSAHTATCTTLPGGAAGYGASTPPRIWVLRRWTLGLRTGLPGVAALRATQLFVLAHELGHATGCWSERCANTWAKRNWGYVARRLGATTARADVLWRALPREWKALCA